jgi:hypothetical protein
VDVEFEEVEERIGESDGTVQRRGMEVTERERGFGLGTGLERDVLEVALGICDLNSMVC